tara:strand:+ start:319 stop:528 length:210 start_codon:yes stop_codon:yes gene_type:complete
LLDDTRCPVPDKSYKDLTPKQIETIYLNYQKVRTAIRNEEINYKDAVEKLPIKIMDVILFGSDELLLNE